MDVRCEQCRTEYHVDEQQLTEAGVAVKCTNCGHVFLVKKAAVAVSMAVPPEIEDFATSAQAVAAPHLGEGSKEWKVRQANGNVFNVQELTTLQKWIVERRVQRDDEISLSGENWKRLGNIAELEPFFQVVDEAQRASHPAAQRAAPPAPGGAMPPKSIPMAGEPTPARRPQGAPPVIAREVNRQERSAGTDRTEMSDHGRTPSPDFERFSFRDSPVEQARSARFDARGEEPAFAKTDPSESFFENDEALERAAGVRQGSSRRFVLILGLLGAALAGYFAYYFGVWRPGQSRNAESLPGTKLSESRPQDPAPAPTPTPAAPSPPEPPAAANPPVQQPATGALSPPSPAEPRPPPGAQPTPPEIAAASNRTPGAGAAADSGTAAEPRRSAAAGMAAADAGTAAPKIVRAEPRTFDFYMGQGDRLREREQPQAALEAYRKAAELEPDRAEPLAGRGLALLDMDQGLQAQVWFQRALKLNPRYSVALMGLAEAYRVDGKAADAIRYYEKYLDVLPDGPEAAVARAAIKNLQESKRD
jgi:predicted Zn finger-like uncharacterized protein